MKAIIRDEDQTQEWYENVFETTQRKRQEHFTEVTTLQRADVRQCLSFSCLLCPRKSPPVLAADTFAISLAFEDSIRLPSAT